jgi:hypothetical protein
MVWNRCSRWRGTALTIPWSKQAPVLEDAIVTSARSHGKRRRGYNDPYRRRMTGIHMTIRNLSPATQA